MNIEIPDEVLHALKKEVVRTGKPLEEIALEWIAEHTQMSERGRVDDLMPFYGAWHMTPEERLRIEQMIYEDRHMEENNS